MPADDLHLRALLDPERLRRGFAPPAPPPAPPPPPPPTGPVALVAELARSIDATLGAEAARAVKPWLDDLEVLLEPAPDAADARATALEGLDQLEDILEALALAPPDAGRGL